VTLSDTTNFLKQALMTSDFAYQTACRYGQNGGEVSENNLNRVEMVDGNLIKAVELFEALSTLPKSLQESFYTQSQSVSSAPQETLSKDAKNQGSRSGGVDISLLLALGMESLGVSHTNLAEIEVGLGGVCVEVGRALDGFQWSCSQLEKVKHMLASFPVDAQNDEVEGLVKIFTANEQTWKKQCWCWEGMGRERSFFDADAS
jgi:hypothetical protein